MNERSQWQLLESEFHRLVALEAGERERELHQLVATQPELAESVRAMLDNAEPAQALFESDQRPQEPRVLGEYQLIREIGRGGMGRVYLAERVDPQLRQQVAIKVIDGRVSSDEFRQRFLRERQILAHLQHPNVARMLDGGVDQAGNPYLVMEYVDGVTITRYCSENQLDLDARIQLFRQVLKATQYAHQQLVVHRDLKPTNILVSSQGEVKLLDFGIAKLMQVWEWMTPMETTVGHQPMTPKYASPEQIMGRPIDTRSDIFSMGVLLYMLLSDSYPFDAATSGYSQLQAIVEQDPVSLRSLVPNLDRDLEAICLKALCRDPNGRYSSVEQFDQDLQNFLDGFPVAAKPKTWLTVARKFCQRHRRSVVAIGLLTVALIGTTLGLWVQTGTLQHQAVQIGLERDRAREVAMFMEDLFRDLDPEIALDRELTARELLDRGRERIVMRFDENDAIYRSLLLVMARVYYHQGHYNDAEALANQVRDQGSFESEHQRMEAEFLFGEICLSQGKYQAAKAIFEQVIASDQLDPDLRASVLIKLGDSERQVGEYESGRERYREALSLVADDRGDTRVRVLAGFANLDREQGAWSKALEAHQEILAYKLDKYPAHHPSVAVSLVSIGDLKRWLGRLDEARSNYETALPALRSAYPEGHAFLASALNSYAGVLTELNDIELAETSYVESIAILERLFGQQHPNTIMAKNNLAVFFTSRKQDFARAEQLFRDVDQQARQVLPPEHPFLLTTRVNLGAVVERQGRAEEAEGLFRANVQVARSIRQRQPARAQDLMRSLRSLGNHLRRNQQALEALPVLKESMQIARELYQDENPELAFSALCTAKALLDLSDWSPAELLLQESLHIYQKNSEMVTEMAIVKTHLARALMGQDQEREARVLLNDGFQVLEAQLGLDYLETQEVVTLLLQLGQNEMETKRVEPVNKRYF